jgi:lysophospholipase L1-like esterase
MAAFRTFTGGLVTAVVAMMAGIRSPFPDSVLVAQAPAQPVSAPQPAAGRGQAAAPLPPALLECPDLAAALRTVANNDARLRDFSQLNRYREANRVVGAVDVVFMGDSITDSWPQERFGPFFPGKRYVSRGISGQTTPQMLVRMRPDVINLKPRAVVILAGTNDIAGNTGPMTDEDIQSNLMSMAELAAASGIKVILSSILPTSNYHVAPNGVPQTTLRPMARIRALNDWMRQYAQAKGHAYLDYVPAMVDSAALMKAELTNDDLHPNAAGYAIMAPLAQAAIDSVLN